jgi:pyruvate kinase
MGRRAKIVCTLGPASSSPDQVSALVTAGLDVARLNMSHGSRDTHLAAYHAVRAACDASGRSVGVLVDLQGPKIRLGRFASGPVTLVAGQEFTITGEDVPGDAGEASTTYPELAGDVRPGTQVLVDDGPRRSRRSQRWWRRSTGSWWPAATWAWSSRWNRCRWPCLTSGGARRATWWWS